MIARQVLQSPALGKCGPPSEVLCSRLQWEARARSSGSACCIALGWLGGVGAGCAVRHPVAQPVLQHWVCSGPSPAAAPLNRAWLPPSIVAGVQRPTQTAGLHACAGGRDAGAPSACQASPGRTDARHRGRADEPGRHRGPGPPRQRPAPAAGVRTNTPPADAPLVSHPPCAEWGSRCPLCIALCRRLTHWVLERRRGPSDVAVLVLSLMAAPPAELPRLM